MGSFNRFIPLFAFACLALACAFLADQVQAADLTGFVMASSAAAIPEAVKEHLESIKSNLKSVLELEPRIKKLEESGGGASELKAQVEKINLDTAKRIDDVKAALEKDFTDRMDAVETEMQKRLQFAGGGSAKTVGQMFVESDEYKNAHDKKSVPGVVIDRSAMKDVTPSANQRPPLYLPDVVRPQDVNLTMRDLIPGGRSARDVVKYVKLTGRATAAAVVAEGGLKPESSLVFADASAEMVKLAHFIPVTEEQLSDIDGLRSIIDAELRYGLDKKEDAEFLNGVGGAGNIHGIIPQATAYDAATYGSTVTTPTMLDHIRGMIAQLQVADYAPDGIVLHPLDWFKIETTKTTDGAYIFAVPQGTVGRRLWGLPVAETTQITAGTGLVGAFQIGAQIFDGQLQGVYGIQVKTGQPNDYFLRNQYAVLAEERVTLAVKRPGAFVTGDLAPVAG